MSEMSVFEPFAYLRSIGADEALAPMEYAVLAAMTVHVNNADGKLRCSLGRIADDVGCDRGTVTRVIQSPAVKAYLRIQRPHVRRVNIWVALPSDQQAEAQLPNVQAVSSDEETMGMTPIGTAPYGHGAYRHSAAPSILNPSKGLGNITRPSEFDPDASATVMDMPIKRVESVKATSPKPVQRQSDRGGAYERRMVTWLKKHMSAELSSRIATWPLKAGGVCLMVTESEIDQVAVVIDGERLAPPGGLEVSPTPVGWMSLYRAGDVLPSRGRPGD